MADFEVGSLLELNRQAMSGLPVLNKENVSLKMFELKMWAMAHKNTKHFMLLSNEKRDYTFFRLETNNYNNFEKELQEVIESRGKIVSIDKNEEFDTYDVWIRCGEENNYYMVFPADDFMIEV